MLRGPAYGVALMLVAQVVMPANDAIAKYLVMLLPALQVTWARFFFNAVLLLPIVFWRHGAMALRTERPALQLGRGLLIVSANICFLFGVRHVPLADALAIVFVTPLAVAALSTRLLGETIGRLQWLAIAAGFIGALVIIRPGFSALGWAALLPLASGLQFAGYLVITRMLAASAPPEVTLALTALTGSVVMTLVIPFVWQMPGWPLLAMMVLVGGLSGIGHMFITAAHVHAPASVLAPLTYLAIVTATLLGYLVFDDLPDAFTWLGMAIVIASGMALWWSQARADRAPARRSGRSPGTGQLHQQDTDRDDRDADQIYRRQRLAEDE